MVGSNQSYTKVVDALPLSYRGSSMVGSNQSYTKVVSPNLVNREREIPPQSHAPLK